MSKEIVAAILTHAYLSKAESIKISPPSGEMVSTEAVDHVGVLYATFLTRMKLYANYADDKDPRKDTP